MFALPAVIRRAMVAHARRERPRECCGLLLGRGNRVAFAMPIENIAEGETRYRIDDAAHLELRRVLRRVVPPLAIIGVYHSHPVGEARPSETDISEAMYPEWAYIIVGLSGERARVRAFRIRRGRAWEVPMSSV